MALCPKDALLTIARICEDSLAGQPIGRVGLTSVVVLESDDAAELVVEIADSKTGEKTGFVVCSEDIDQEEYVDGDQPKTNAVGLPFAAGPVDPAADIRMLGSPLKPICRVHPSDSGITLRVDDEQDATFMLEIRLEHDKLVQFLSLINHPQAEASSASIEVVNQE
jgi:hypothetical protein